MPRSPRESETKMAKAKETMMPRARMAKETMLTLRTKTAKVTMPRETTRPPMMDAKMQDADPTTLPFRLASKSTLD